MIDHGGKSLRVPTMPIGRWIEIRDMRIAQETLAIGRTAEWIDAEGIRALWEISLALTAARECGDVVTDRALIARFQLSAYAAGADVDMLPPFAALIWLILRRGFPPVR